MRRVDDLCRAGGELWRVPARGRDERQAHRPCQRGDHDPPACDPRKRRSGTGDGYQDHVRPHAEEQAAAGPYSGREYRKNYGGDRPCDRAGQLYVRAGSAGIRTDRQGDRKEG